VSRPGRDFAVATALAIAGMPGMALAHAFAERYDLPLPLGFYLAGAGAAVGLSFLGSFLLMRPGRTRTYAVAVPVPAIAARACGFAVRVTGISLLAWVVAAGLFGPSSPTQNFATVFIWVIWWVGFTLASALVVDLFSPGNPIRSLIGGTAGSLITRELFLSPAWGWLAVSGLLGIGWMELVSERS